jgi:hypothetical protein
LGRQRLEQAKDELLMTGNATTLAIPQPHPLPPRASDRQTRGQKKVLTKLKGQATQKPSSRSDLMLERKKIRNYNLTAMDEASMS